MIAGGRGFISGFILICLHKHMKPFPSLPAAAYCTLTVIQTQSCFQSFVLFSSTPQSQMKLIWTATKKKEFGFRPVKGPLRLQVRLHIDLSPFSCSELSHRDRYGSVATRWAPVVKAGCWKMGHSKRDLVVWKKMLNWFPSKDVHSSQSTTNSKTHKYLSGKTMTLCENCEFYCSILYLY